MLVNEDLAEALCIDKLLVTEPKPCSYIPGQVEMFLIPSPPEGTRIGIDCATILSRSGFRRNGTYYYRPHCPMCNACISVRLKVKEFKPDRTMRRVARFNENLRYKAVDTEFSEEHFELFKRYLNGRHPGGTMSQMTEQDYIDSILTTEASSCLLEYRDENSELVMVSLVDIFKDGVSAAYTFFDPSRKRNSLGTFGILCQIEAVKKIGLPYLYLGYWIRECKNMAYKSRFQPLEVLADENRWIPFETFIALTDKTP